MIRFFVTLLIVAAGAQHGRLGIGCIRIGSTALPSFFFQTTILFYCLVRGLLYIYLYRFNKPDFFIQLYLLTMAVKLLAYGAYNFFMIMEDRQGAANNVVWFMILYFIFTGLEIAFLYQKISKR